MAHTIVGIDTGKTAAIVCLDLDGRIIYARTRRFADMRWFIDTLKSTGTPSVIASDKRRASASLVKLASIFDAALYTPKEDISVVRKKGLSSGLYITNIHERDAFSAAIAAYNAYANKLKQAERLARERKIKDVDRIKAMVIKKHSIYEAMENKRASRFVR